MVICCEPRTFVSFDACAANLKPVAYLTVADKNATPVRATVNSQQSFQITNIYLWTPAQKRAPKYDQRFSIIARIGLPSFEQNSSFVYFWNAKPLRLQGEMTHPRCARIFVLHQHMTRTEHHIAMATMACAIDRKYVLENKKLAETIPVQKEHPICV